MCDVPNTAAFVENLLNAFLVFFSRFFKSFSYNSSSPNDYWYDEAYTLSAKVGNGLLYL